MTNPNAELFGHFESLTFDDLLVVPGWSEVLPHEVSTTTMLDGITLHTPLLSAAMDTVSEAPLCIALAREGGIGVLHRNLSIEAQAGRGRSGEASPGRDDQPPREPPSVGHVGRGRGDDGPPQDQRSADL